MLSIITSTFTQIKLYIITAVVLLAMLASGYTVYRFEQSSIVKMQNTIANQQQANASLNATVTQFIKDNAAQKQAIDAVNNAVSKAATNEQTQIKKIRTSTPKPNSVDQSVNELFDQIVNETK